MTPYLFLNRRTAGLFIAYKVHFITDREVIYSESIAGNLGVVGFQIAQDGWILEHPEFTVPIFLNLKGAHKLFENLGPIL